jgi:nitroreductase
MLPLSVPVTEAIRQRYSCRVFQRAPIAAAQAGQLAEFARSIRAGPLATPLRFVLVAGEDQDPNALKGLGTYGLIKNPAGFIVGAVGPGQRNLEDYGYGLETVVLHATGLGLGTCWVGGSFSKSGFSRRIGLSDGEIVPAVIAVGHPAEDIRNRDWHRRWARSDTRKPWEALFFQTGAASALSAEEAGAYAAPLKMLRLAPSGHNYQPWRVIRDGACFHFFLQRTPGYGPGSLTFALLGLADLPRVEIGIGMCHFELAARELGLDGQWSVQDPALAIPGDEPEYVVTWTDRPAAPATVQAGQVAPP